MNRYRLRTQSEPNLVYDPDASDEWPFRTEGERWTAIVEAEGSTHIMFSGTGSTEVEAIENLKLVP